MHTVVALAIQPMMEFSISLAGWPWNIFDRTSLICSNRVHVRPYSHIIIIFILLFAFDLQTGVVRRGW